MRWATRHYVRRVTAILRLPLVNQAYSFDSALVDRQSRQSPGQWTRRCRRARVPYPRQSDSMEPARLDSARSTRARRTILAAFDRPIAVKAISAARSWSIAPSASCVRRVPFLAEAQNSHTVNKTRSHQESFADPVAAVVMTLSNSALVAGLCPSQSNVLSRSNKVSTAVPVNFCR
jgi:hypothetical protein